MNKDELYHYGVPGMRWGRRKANVVVGQNVKTAKKQDVKNSKYNKNYKQTTKQENKNPKQRVEKQESQTTTSSSNKGLLIATAALAVIGAVIISRKLNGRTGDVSKKVSIGKKTVEKHKNVKIPTKTHNPIKYNPKVLNKVSNPIKYDIKAPMKSRNPFRYHP